MLYSSRVVCHHLSSCNVQCCWHSSALESHRIRHWVTGFFCTDRYSSSENWQMVMTADWASTCISFLPMILEYLHNLVSVQSTGRTRSSSPVTLARPSVSSSLQVTNCSFTYASPYLWNQLPSNQSINQISLIQYDKRIHINEYNK